jgi:hypothetical protein
VILAASVMGLSKLRRCDTNTLLRLHDKTKAAQSRPITMHEHRRAAMARDRIATELRKRGFRV